ncbi:hypothetical protein [Streptomyces muensis]|uniref:Thioesterase family protein n=1 Tax=Streptomyces muensis TaxID=1077944 RepID=A0A9X1Q6T6_STRM4|nr:hypothetical protein [Streptomyces muensis]MCF1599566.1 hypothetical protein [Streptomyces muensis]
MPAASVLTVAPEFNGPPDSANGGYACGRLAALAEESGHLAGQVAVTLHLPVPLGTPVEYRPAGRRGHVWHGEDVIASVAATSEDVPAPAPVEPDRVQRAEHAFTGVGHPFPGCFVCGTQRPHDGLSLRPGLVEGREATVACAWRPSPELATEDGTVPSEIVWSALDCPGGWTADPVRQPRLLSRMTARITERPVVGGSYVVVGSLEGVEGRMATNATALYDADGRLLAAARAQWIAVDVRS